MKKIRKGFGLSEYKSVIGSSYHDSSAFTQSDLKTEGVWGQGIGLALQVSKDCIYARHGLIT